LRLSPDRQGSRPTRSVRLLLVVDSLEAGGAERHVVDLAVALRRRGYEVTVASSIADGLAEPLERADIPVRPLLDRRVKRRLSLAFAWRLRRLIKRGHFDLVHAHIYASAGAAATANAGVPLVITEHTEALWQTRSARMVCRWVYARAEHVIAVSTAIRRRLIERDSVPPQRITVIPNAVTSAATASHALPSLPAGWHNVPLVGVVARLQPEKGVAAFLKAAACVAPLFPEVGFLVVGDGPLREELKGLARQLGLEQRVHFLGHRPDARALIELLDVLVVPSFTEGSPLIVLETMAAGVPVVASAVGGIPDQVRHDKEGLLVPPGDPRALGDALLRLLRDSDYARSLGEAGRERVASEFSYANMLQRIETVYRVALGQPPAPSATSEGREIKAAH
jgi:glycosyltransferase involved in cell wall biosynthesis